MESRSLAAADLRDLLKIDVGLIPSLALNGGSAIVTFDGSATRLLINRESDTDFHVLDPRCTHQGCIVDPYSIASNTIFCPCHSSRYDISGHVVRGPAVSDLFKFKASFDGASVLSVEVPGFVHHLEDVSVASAVAGSTRLCLTFPTISGADYQVCHSPTLAEPFAPAAFSSTPSGMADQNSLRGTGAVTSVYVDSADATAFYRLDLLIYQLA
ncbi:MAG: Rieske (2Fe-2S) protein [Verrucomicrobiaceae bacterium]|nr:Rieske (2Fe-2S) protein [Verrucomicrobiaceae bacterium]